MTDAFDVNCYEVETEIVLVKKEKEWGDNEEEVVENANNCVRYDKLWIEDETNYKLKSVKSKVIYKYD